MIDFFSDEMRRNPFPVYDQLRAASPVFHVPPPIDLWMVLDYAGVNQALADHDAFSNDLSVAGRGNPQWLIFFDPPRHTKLRALINRAFTPRVVADLEPRIRALSRDLLDRVIGRGEMDLAADYAAPLPMTVIAGMIGIPAADWALFRGWSDAILNLSHDIAPGSEAGRRGVADFKAASEEMAAYLPGLVGPRRSAPTGDLLSRLVTAEVDGERLTDDEILRFVQLLVVAGQETTANLITNAVLCLTEHPDQLARLRANPDLLPSAIEEVLRYRSPLQWVFRATRREVALPGGVVPAGKVVLLVIGSANRDPRQFPDPARFDIARDPNPHVAFGHGIHACLGAPLSRLEARIALADLLGRLDGLALASDEPWEPRKALHVHAPTRLPVRFEPGRRSVEGRD